MDVVGKFLGDMCLRQPGMKVKLRVLFEAYHKWCEENNERAMNDRFFSMQLKELGFTQTRDAESRYWADIGLKAEP
jgi:phage/plasmid-associated DNA primase